MRGTGLTDARPFPRTHLAVRVHARTVACASACLPLALLLCLLSHVDLTFCVFVPTLLSGRAAASHEVPPSTEESQG